MKIFLLILMIIPQIGAVFEDAKRWAEEMALKVEEAYEEEENSGDVYLMLLRSDKAPPGGKQLLMVIVDGKDYKPAARSALFPKPQKRSPFDTPEKWAWHMNFKISQFYQRAPNDKTGIIERAVLRDEEPIPPGGAKMLLIQLEGKPYKETVLRAINERLVPGTLSNLSPMPNQP